MVFSKCSYHKKIWTQKVEIDISFLIFQLTIDIVADLLFYKNT